MSPWCCFNLSIDPLQIACFCLISLLHVLNAARTILVQTSASFLVFHCACWLTPLIIAHCFGLAYVLCNFVNRNCPPSRFCLCLVCEDVSSVSSWKLLSPQDTQCPGQCLGEFPGSGSPAGLSTDALATQRGDVFYSHASLWASQQPFHGQLLHTGALS